MASESAITDIILRKGDIVVTDRGFFMFRGFLADGTHPANTPGRHDLPVKIAQAATSALCCWFAFQFQGSRSATLLAG
jgi:hypothetical protein